ncbi:hypothetical protein R84B8_01645 [Treponema sp. R8-4-B8]
MNSDEFVKQYYAIANRALEFSEKARREGLLAIEDDIDGEKVDRRDVLEYGMRFVVDGVDAEIIRDILSNITAQEKDEKTRVLKNIQLEAVMSIQAGDSTRILLSMLNSCTDLPVNEDEILKKHLEA